MPAEENKAVLRQAIENFNEGDLATYLEFYDESLVLHGYPPEIPPNFDGVRQFYTALFSAFPDSRVEVEDVIAEGDRLACRYTFRAAHRGEFVGIPATGRRVEMGGITILRFADGKCVERWQKADMLGLMQQLGAVPVPEPARA